MAMMIKMMMAKAVISLIGPPGSGKGTYGSLLASRLDAAFISVGDILRENAEVSSILKSGALVNDIIVNEAVIHSLEGSSVSDKSMIILDGYPRTGPQSHLLAKWPVNLRPSFAIQFDVPYEVCTIKLLGRRICSICKKSINVNGVDTLGFVMPPMLPDVGSCDVRCNPDLHWKKRNDDTVDTIKLRMEIYDKETRPLLEYFEKRKQLLRFVPYNGIKDMDKLVSYVETRLHTLI
jgi:adenylate kinase